MVQVRKLYDDDQGNTCEFHKLLKRTPGWSHRVSINGIAADWLRSDTKPSAKTAEFFLAKHCPPIAK